MVASCYIDHVGGFYQGHGESFRASDGDGGSTLAGFKFASDWTCG